MKGAKSMVVSTENQRMARISDIKKDEKKEEKQAKKRKYSPYKKWTQVNGSEEAYNAEDWLIANAPTAYRILRFFVTNMDKYNAIICSYKVIQEKFDYSKSTVERSIKILKEHKYVEVKKSGASNVYLINKNLYWNSWGTNYAYAEFGAKVILTASEQDKETQEEIKIQIKKRQEIELNADENSK